MTFVANLAETMKLPRRARVQGLDVVIGDLARAETALALAEVCDPALNAALVGDKRFLFSGSGRSFIAYGVRGRTWLALGGPVGLADELEPLARRFMAMARQARAKAAFYSVRPEFAPLARALGLRMLKTGERALLDLTGFSLDGKTRQVIRTHRNRHIKQGFRVEVHGPGAARTVTERLREISDQWLTHQPGQSEKGFGLGRFEAHYVDRLPLALVRGPGSDGAPGAGQIVAFASLWPTADRSRIGVDLMRFGADGPNGVMDYLFAEIFLWAKAEGYRAFDLNTAPMAGVSTDAQAPLTTTLARLAFEYGEHFYNFKGVHRFKKKFHPDWEDVLLAWPPGASPLSALATAAVLTNRPKFPKGGFTQA